MVRKIGGDFLRRYDENPILTAEDIPFRSNAVFNGSPVKFDGEYLFLFRVEGLQGHLFFALARSRKGFYYKVDEKPVMFPEKNGKFTKYEKRETENTRITFMGGIMFCLQLSQVLGR
jgi:predicted GH43/DUF377 family glycosyl hydrolase